MAINIEIVILVGTMIKWCAEAGLNFLKKYDILNQKLSEGAFYITANQIKEFKEPRLMAKWDSSERHRSVSKSIINILLLARTGYVLRWF